MSSSSRTSPTALRRVGTAFGVLLLAAAMLLTATPAQAAPSPASASASAALAGDDKPHLPVQDFPNLPERCYYPKLIIIKPQACTINTFKADRPSVMLWGDSHAFEYLPALKNAVKGRNTNLVTFVAGGCPAVGMTKKLSKDGRCQTSNYHALEWVREQVRKHRDFKVIISSNFSGYRLAYQRIFVDQQAEPDEFKPYVQEMTRLQHHYTPKLFSKLGELKAPTDVIGQSGVYPNVKLPCPKGDEPYRCDLPRSQVFPAEYDTRRWLMSMTDRLSGHPRYIDTSDVYCSQFICHGEVGSIPTFFDHLHLGSTLTGTMASHFVPSIKDLR